MGTVRLMVVGDVPLIQGVMLTRLLLRMYGELAMVVLAVSCDENLRMKSPFSHRDTLQELPQWRVWLTKACMSLRVGDLPSTYATVAFLKAHLVDSKKFGGMSRCGVSPSHDGLGKEESDTGGLVPWVKACMNDDGGVGERGGCVPRGEDVIASLGTSHELELRRGKWMS